jgi:hypothetical protein
LEAPRHERNGPLPIVQLVRVLVRVNDNRPYPSPRRGRLLIGRAGKAVPEGPRTVLGLRVCRKRHSAFTCWPRTPECLCTVQRSNR